MRILPSRRRRYAIALLLTFAAWLAGCWWLMPYRAKRTFQGEKDYAAVWDVSPDKRAAFVVGPNSHYFDLIEGKSKPDPRSEELRHTRVFKSRGSPGDIYPFVWNQERGEQCLNFRRANGITRASATSIGVINQDSLRGFRLECVSDNERFYAASFKDDKAYSWDMPGRPDRVVVIDLDDGRQIASLAGACYPVTISPTGESAITVSIKQNGNENQVECRFVLWDLQAARPLREFPEWNSDEALFEVIFYSPDGQYIFSHSSITYADSGNVLTWRDKNGRRIATVHHRVFRSQQVLVDSGRILVTDGLESTLDFYDVADGKKLGEWQLKESPLGAVRGYLIGSIDGKYVALSCSDDRQKPPSKLAAWDAELGGHLNLSENRSFLVVIDAIERKEVARLPAGSAQFSRDGTLLVTMDPPPGLGLPNHPNISVYDLPLRKPWARIFGFAAIGTLGCGGAFCAVRWFRMRLGHH